MINDLNLARGAKLTDGTRWLRYWGRYQCNTSKNKGVLFYVFFDRYGECIEMRKEDVRKLDYVKP